MKNEYWIFYKTKKSQQLVIDIYDDKYMELSREERFSELKRLLSNDIMDIKRVHILCQDNGCMLEIKKSWYGIERIVKIHQLLENAYASWATPWEERNPVFDSGVLIPDNSYDNSHIPHYKIKAPKRSDASRNKHKEGDVYTKSDGEVYTIVYNTERRVCELVWESFHGEIPAGHRVFHIDGNKQNNRLDNLKLVEE